MATPQVPPRPARAQQPASDLSPDHSAPAPRIPPRPAGRRKDRSVSPDRYAPSPLNEMPRKPSTGALYSSAHGNRSASSIDSPARPPSVTIPTLGEEGNEYGDLERHEDQKNALDLAKSEGSGTQTSHVGSDLPLHAPKPALAKSSAQAQVAAVTRTDSAQAASPGIGYSMSPREDQDPYHQPLRSKTSSTHVRPPSSAASDRPGSASLDKDGIPHIGRYVPMLPNAGDVQAPSPATASLPIESPEARPRHHGRKHSGREVFHGPPGSYGLHGHGVPANDKFEKSWYAKHPEELAKEEHGHYSPALSDNRPEWALSSDDLNKIVQNSAKGAGFGTSANIVGLPNEQIGYLASDEFAQRMTSPRSPTSKHNRRQSGSQSHVESPLRQEAFHRDAIADVLAKASQGTAADGIAPGEGQDIIHIDPVEDPINKVTGEGVDTHESTHHRRVSNDGDGGFAEEHGYSAPILASDEVAPGSEWQQPAVSPGLVPDRRGSAQFDDMNHLHRHLSHLGSPSSSRHGSRPGSRPGSIHGVPALSKMTSHDEHEERHTPLENVEEYEPLFPDDDGKVRKPITQAERLLRMKQRFPSQDIWEDTPNSLQLEAEVTSPEPPEEVTPRMAAAVPAFETPAQEAARKRAAGAGSENNLTLTPTQELLAKAGFQTVKSRPDASSLHRFPSRDIWEDSPDHAELTTTVDGPQEDEVDLKEEANTHPFVPPRPLGSKNLDGQKDGPHPKIPPRPPKKQFSTESSEGDTRKPPSIPDRPKPSIPARPAKSTSRDASDAPGLTKTTSIESTGSIEEEGVKAGKPAPPTKPKPMVPSRPAGGKIAALKQGFMADLNSRLQIGPKPQPPAAKSEEVVEEKVPLQDARKGRARGPARRKPAAHSASPQPARETQALQLSLSAVWTVWQSDLEGRIEVPGVLVPSDKEQAHQHTGIETHESITPDLATDSPVVEEPKPISKQSTMDQEPAASSGDHDPELPVLPTVASAKEDNEEIVEKSNSSDVAAAIPAETDTSIPPLASHDAHVQLEQGHTASVKSTPDVTHADVSTVESKEEIDTGIANETIPHSQPTEDEHVEPEI